MQVGRGDQELHGQTGTAAEQGMHAIAAQQWSEMVCRSMAGGGVGILSMPGQDGSTVDDQIASPNQMAAHSTPDHEHEEGLKGRRSCCLPAFAPIWKASQPSNQSTTRIMTIAQRIVPNITCTPFMRV